MDLKESTPQHQTVFKCEQLNSFCMPARVNGFYSDMQQKTKPAPDTTQNIYTIQKLTARDHSNSETSPHIPNRWRTHFLDMLQELWELLALRICWSGQPG